MTDSAQAIKLVKEVQKHPCLYNTNIKEYSNRELTEQAWAEVADAVDMSANWCRKKWRHFRVVYTRSLKPGYPNKRAYYLAKHLKFVLPFNKPVKCETFSETKMVEEETDEADSDTQKYSNQLPSFELHSVADTTATPQAANGMDGLVLDYFKAKKAKFVESTEDKIHESNKMFLLSLLPDLGGMSDSQLRLFKRSAISLIEQILEDNFNNVE